MGTGQHDPHRWVSRYTAADRMVAFPSHFHFHLCILFIMAGVFWCRHTISLHRSQHLWSFFFPAHQVGIHRRGIVVDVYFSGQRKLDMDVHFVW
ncbi:hypothetical protein BS50DRAFT_104718 [Corynespora cassiicola Philippines]|uniref:Transmembrane protein n=1 Tax=Corynespora cassiicola Philippines TaxID=1448308 RepID=A0A2T2ND16_CORCC|nr:hypothetical protein BS50DRAFT_104718 [Corynespora cassiicola Philippines]